ncbi:hypothetical protein C8J56DRAFT_1164058 [Mycena floridula]|nr:hypothetical protein C8J56DRAFT_1164058 [Mycena floridula]
MVATVVAELIIVIEALYRRHMSFLAAFREELEENLEERLATSSEPQSIAYPSAAFESNGSVQQPVQCQYAPKKRASRVRTPIQHQFEQNPALANLFSRSDVSLSPETSSLCPNIPSMTSIPDSPPPSTKPVPESSYASDVDSGDYNMVWDNEAGFKEWLKLEESRKSIEFRVTHNNPGKTYNRSIRRVCARNGTGGASKYRPKFPEHQRKVESKRTGCGALLTIKTYNDTNIVLGKYVDQHDHPLGNDNVRFTRISKETREYIASLLRMHIEPAHILKLVHQGCYHNTDANPKDFKPDLSHRPLNPPSFSEPATIPFIQAHYEPVPKQQFPISSAPFEQQQLFSQQFYNGYLTPQFYQPPFVQQAIPDQYSMVPQYYIV